MLGGACITSWFTLIGDHLLPEGFTNMQRDVFDIWIIGLFVVDEVGGQFVDYLGIVYRRFEGARDVF